MVAVEKWWEELPRCGGSHRFLISLQEWNRTRLVTPDTSPYFLTQDPHTMNRKLTVLLFALTLLVVRVCGTSLRAFAADDDG